MFYLTPPRHISTLPKADSKGTSACGAKQTFNPTDRCARNFMPAVLHRRHRHLLALINESWCGSCLSEYLAGARHHVFPCASILARISDFNTLPTLERGRSSHTSICLGVLTLPTRCFTKSDTAGDIDCASCSRLHHSDNAFAPLLVWQTDDGTILNGFVGLKGVLDLDGIDVEAASNESCLLRDRRCKGNCPRPVTDITRMMPAVHGGLRRCFGVLVVPSITSDPRTTISPRSPAGIKIAVAIHDADPNQRPDTARRRTNAQSRSKPSGL